MLLGNLKDIRGTQLRRMTAQAIIMLIAHGMTGIYIRRPAELGHPNFSFVGTIPTFENLLLSSFLGIFYEVFAPGLADGNVSRVPAILMWLFVQANFAVYVGALAEVGLFGGKLSHVRVLMFLNLTSCVLEFVISEAWIAKAKNESAEYKVASWAEIESLLSAYDDVDPSEAES